MTKLQEGLLSSSARGTVHLQPLGPEKQLTPKQITFLFVRVYML